MHGSFLLIFDVFFLISDVLCFYIVVFEYLDLASQRTMPPVVRLDAGASLLVKSRLAVTAISAAANSSAEQCEVKICESRHCLCELVVLKMLYLVLSRTVEYG